MFGEEKKNIIALQAITNQNITVVKQTESIKTTDFTFCFVLNCSTINSIYLGKHEQELIYLISILVKRTPSMYEVIYYFLSLMNFVTKMT